MAEPIKTEVPSWTVYSVATAPLRAAMAVVSAPYYAGAYAWSLVPSRVRPSTPAETPAPPSSPAKAPSSPAKAPTSEVEVKTTVERAVSPQPPAQTNAFVGPLPPSPPASTNVPFVGPLPRTHIQEVVNSFSS